MPLLRRDLVVASLLAIITVCVTVLVALGRVTWDQALMAISGLLAGSGLAWNRGVAPSKDDVPPKDPTEAP